MRHLLKCVRVKGEKTSVNWVTCHRCIPALLVIPPGEPSLDQGEGLSVACAAASCCLSAQRVRTHSCVAVLPLSLYLKKHFTPPQGSKCTLASAWCTHCVWVQSVQDNLQKNHHTVNKSENLISVLTWRDHKLRLQKCFISVIPHLFYCALMCKAAPQRGLVISKKNF